MKQEQTSSTIPESEPERFVKIEKVDSIVKMSPFKQMRFGESPSLDFKSPDYNHLLTKWVINSQKLNFNAESPSQLIPQSQNQFAKSQSPYPQNNHFNQNNEDVNF